MLLFLFSPKDGLVRTQLSSARRQARVAALRAGPAGEADWLDILADLQPAARRRSRGTATPILLTAAWPPVTPAALELPPGR